MMTTTSAAAAQQQQQGQQQHARHIINARGRYLDLPQLINQECCYEGPAGTSKTRTILEYIHLVLKTFPGSRALLARWRLVDLTGSAVQTYRDEVLQPWDRVRWYGGSQAEPPAFIYPNGSRILLTGLDKPEKVKSKSYNLVFVNEATELQEGDIEMVRSRTGRDNRLPFWQVILDANPGPPTHWLNQRMLAGRTVRCETSHRDNPGYYDDAGAITPMGERYIFETLAGLTGVRRARLLEGRWVAAEGTVYEDAWAPERTLRPRTLISKRPGDLTGDCGIDPTWPRYVSIDWGFVNPAVVQWFAQDGDGRLWLYRELYQTQTLVEDLARRVLALMGWELRDNAHLPKHAHPDPLPREILGDHDAADRATFERHSGLYIRPAHKAIADGIQAVTKRLQDERLLVLRDATVARDPALLAKKAPTSTVDEFDSYVWDTRSGRSSKELPMDRDNHGMDALRYAVATLDRRPTGVQWGPKIWATPAANATAPVSPLERFITTRGQNNT